MEWEDIQGKKYPGYGRCIYCGSDGGRDGLRSEHVIPFSMGGETEIKDANCVACQDTINPIDTHLAKVVFGDYRIHVDAPTRNPEDRPTTLPATFTVAGQEIKRELPVKDHPYTLAMPVWGDPGFFRGAPIDALFPDIFVHAYHHLPENMHETLGVKEDDPYMVWVNSRMNISLFARAIAKIAYCNTVIKYGLDGFRPLILPDMILGRFSGTSYFVGGPLDNPPPPFEKGGRHQIFFTELDSNPNHPSAYSGALRLIVAGVRLFADSGHKEHGLPIYRVITGARSLPKIDKRRPVLKTPKRICL
jgi:hypothetical protein